jgi:hypothetical protein
MAAHHNTNFQKESGNDHSSEQAKKELVVVNLQVFSAVLAQL